MSNSEQLSARERINCLLDANSFVEIGANVSKRNTDFNLQQKDAPSDGVITGYGVIDCNPVYVYSQDVSVLNGTVGEMHARKIASLYDMALKVGAPVIGLIDCGGLRLQEATDALNGFGEIYMKQITASGIIPQISAIFGTCGGASAISAAMTDFVFITKESGKLFVCAPNTIDGNYVGKCDTSAAEYVSTTGNVDFVYDDEQQLLDGIRKLVSFLPSNNEDNDAYEECDDDLNRLTAELSSDIKDSSFTLSIIADNNEFIEIKKDYAPEMVTGFLRLNGNTVGAIANRSELFDEDGKVAKKLDSVMTSKGCKKAAKFVKFCDAFSIPVLTLTDVTGFAATKCNEKTLAASVATLTSTFADATVPKINVVTGKAYGTAYIAMNSKHIGADMVFAWPDSQIGTMDSKNAAQIIYAQEIEEAKDKQAFINEKAELYGFGMSSAQSAAKRGYVDSIIEPQSTRKNLIYAFDMLFTKRDTTPFKKHGTI